MVAFSNSIDSILPEKRCSCYRLLETDARYAAAWYNKGSSLDALSRHEEAISCYDKVLEIDWRDIGAWNDKANSLIALDRPEEAMECWDRALTLDSECWQAWFNKGCCLNALGAHEEAIGCYDKAVQIDEQDMRAWFNKAVAEENCGRRKDAAQSYRRFLELVPPQHTAHINHARQRISMRVMRKGKLLSTWLFFVAMSKCWNTFEVLAKIEFCSDKLCLVPHFISFTTMPPSFVRPRAYLCRSTDTVWPSTHRSIQ